MADPVARLSTALGDRYRIERELGAGGMAVVYLAHDIRHDRRVALKVLRPELGAVVGAARFLREIRLTANLQHPHILPLHDSGEADGLLYYVMPYVEGESLRSRIEREKQLPVVEAIELTRQVASALDYAHRHGVIHRDIKPENLLLHEGQVLVADFGIALAVSAAGGDRLTETGLSIGTPHYMSPEQATGEREIDARSDEYALACVLYEMLAGDPPYTGSTAQAITARKLTGTVPSLRPVREVGAELDRVIARALARVPADRYATMAQFAEALGGGVGEARKGPGRRRVLQSVLAAAVVVAAAGTLWMARESIRSLFETAPRFARVAVLPLENRTGDSTRNYLVNGLSEALVSDLARLEGVDLISLAYISESPAAGKPVDSLASQLGVGAVVEGWVTQGTGQLEVEVRLRSPGQAAAAPHVFQRPADQVAGLEQEMTRALVREIGGRIAGPRRSSSAVSSANQEAHDLYLKGRYHLNSRTPEGLQSALDYFRQVLGLDPAHALAYAGLAQYYSVLPFYTNTLPSEAFAKAKAAALRALELDPYLPAAHASLAYVLAYHEWDWTGAEAEYRRALALQPSSSEAHHALSRLLSARGRQPEAAAEAERAFALDPLSLVAHANIGVIAYFGRDYAEADRRLKATLELDPEFSTAIWGRGLVLEQLGRYDEAIAAFEKAMAIAGRGTNGLASMGHASGLAGRKADAEQALQEVLARVRDRPILGYQVALVLVGLGRTDEALTWLERAYEQRSTLLSYIDRDPRLDPLRSSPRFRALLTRMHFAP
jgi:serine/threonine-protein kinase